MAELQDVFAAIDAANARDPDRVEVAGALRPAAVVYGERMTAALQAFEPSAGVVLQIAARGQHIERWTVPRATYPEGRVGYLTWRRELQRFHARRVGEILAELGFDAGTAARVGRIIRKERLQSDPEVQTLEDVACLVFIEHYLAPFAARQDDDKLAGILARTWRKMSPRARAAVGAAPPPQRILDLLAVGLARAETRE